MRFGLYMHPHGARAGMEWVEEELSAGLVWGRVGGWMERLREGGNCCGDKGGGWVYFYAAEEVMRGTRGQCRRQCWSLGLQGLSEGPSL